MRAEARDGVFLAGAFVALALLTGWLFAGLLPLGQAADEGAHAVRVEALSHGRVFGHRQGTGGGFDTPGTLLAIASITPPGHLQTRAERDQAEAITWETVSRFHDIGTIATYFPAVYVPAAITLAVFREADFTPAQAFRAARRANVAMFALLGGCAILVARRGRALILAVLLLPMALSLAASLSGDGLLTALAALAAALLTRRTGPSWWLAACALTLLALTKLPYVPLALALLVGPVPGVRVRASMFALTCVVAVGWAAANQATVMGVVGAPDYASGPLWPGLPRQFNSFDPPAQWQVLAADPTRAVTLVSRTLADDVWIRRQAIGVLGWLHIVLPDWLYLAWTGVVVVLVAALAAEPWPGSAALLGSAGIVGGAWAIMLAQYLAWTPVGAAAIEGIQGRYFLPLLPFFCVAIPGWAIGKLRLLATLPLLAGAMGVVALPPIVALASYLR